MNKLILISSVAALLATSAAQANEWGGYYLGGSVETSLDGNWESTFDDGSQADGDIDASLFTLNMGYNYQAGSVVYGFEGSYGFGSFDDGYSSIDGSIFDLNMKAGYAFGKILPYATLGYSTADVELGNGTARFSGINYGVGVNYMINEKIIVGLEVLNRDLSLTNGIDWDSDLNLTNAAVTFAYKF